MWIYKNTIFFSKTNVKNFSCLFSIITKFVEIKEHIIVFEETEIVFYEKIEESKEFQSLEILRLNEFANIFNVYLIWQKGIKKWHIYRKLNFRGISDFILFKPTLYMVVSIKKGKFRRRFYHGPGNRMS